MLCLKKGALLSRGAPFFFVPRLRQHCAEFPLRSLYALVYW
jgi:hypothetical protein